MNPWTEGSAAAVESCTTGGQRGDAVSLPGPLSTLDAKERRVAWLLNHTTLREFEVPLLRSLGFEVFCPKRFPETPDNRSASVSHEFDASLSIPDAELKALNAFDFYSQRLPPAVRRILNERFGTVVVAYMFPMFEHVLEQFRGRILLRTFGSTSSTFTYYSWAREVASPAFERRLARASGRFWFAQAYPNLKWIEPPIIQRRSVHLPLGLPDRVTRCRNAWEGSDPTILFVCPEIKTYEETRQTYEEFKSLFGDLRHVICGAQSKCHPDPAVLGKVDAPTFDRLFRTCNVMFYHSRLPRHLHYHPLEAICYGMPLVYMQQGMLGHLAGRKLPGACDTLQEARSKVERLIEGRDTALADEIRESQGEIYRLFTREHVAAHWKREFVDRVVAQAVEGPAADMRIAVLPLGASASASADCLEVAERLGNAAASDTAMRTAGVGLRCRVGTLEAWTPDTRTATASPFAWREISPAALRYAQRLSGHARPVAHPSTAVPEDGTSDFMDCDAWIVVGDRCTMPIAPVKPYLFRFAAPGPGSVMSEAERRATAISLQNAAAVIVRSDAERDVVAERFGVSPDWIVSSDGQPSGDPTWQILKNVP